MMQHSMINSAMGSGHWLWMLMIALIVIFLHGESVSESVIQAGWGYLSYFR